MRYPGYASQRTPGPPENPRCTRSHRKRISGPPAGPARVPSRRPARGSSRRPSSLTIKARGGSRRAPQARQRPPPSELSRVHGASPNPLPYARSASVNVSSVGRGQRARMSVTTDFSWPRGGSSALSALLIDPHTPPTPSANGINRARPRVHLTKVRVAVISCALLTSSLASRLSASSTARAQTGSARRGAPRHSPGLPRRSARRGKPLCSSSARAARCRGATVLRPCISSRAARGG
jgi:hypothetical protein